MEKVYLSSTVFLWRSPTPNTTTLKHIEECWTSLNLGARAWRDQIFGLAGFFKFESNTAFSKVHG